MANRMGTWLRPPPGRRNQNRESGNAALLQSASKPFWVGLLVNGTDGDGSGGAVSGMTAMFTSSPSNAPMPGPEMKNAKRRCMSVDVNRILHRCEKEGKPKQVRARDEIKFKGRHVIYGTHSEGLADECGNRIGHFEQLHITHLGIPEWQRFVAATRTQRMASADDYSFIKRQART